MENKYSGYIYGPKTVAGFNRMQRLGFPRPIFSVENKINTHLKKAYQNSIKKILDDFSRIAQSTGLTQDADISNKTADFFNQLAENKDLNQRTYLVMAMNNLQREWEQASLESDYDEYSEEWKKKLDKILFENQKDFLTRLNKDASDKFQARITDFSIDKQQLFNQHMKRIRELYLDNSLERIQGEENELKREFLKKLNAYIIGDTETLDVLEITKELLNDCARMARFFARDQMARFNKAVTIATYEDAGVTKVKWVTAQDGRVRNSHAALNGQVFSIDNLPSELNDYNCRCGLIPVEYRE
jgi:SPP1 gp7 family putative phage head morphogenesis protein